MPCAYSRLADPLISWCPWHVPRALPLHGVTDMGEVLPPRSGGNIKTAAAAVIDAPLVERSDHQTRGASLLQCVERAAPLAAAGDGARGLQVGGERVAGEFALRRGDEEVGAGGG
jgi:hypothetical protein